MKLLPGLFAIGSWIILCVICLAVLPSQALGAPRHALDLELDPAQARLVATDRLTLRVPETGLVTLSLAPQVDIDQVRVGETDLPWRFDNGRLRIGPLPDLPEAEFTLEIRYHGTFADPVPVAPLNNEDPTYGVAATISDQGTFLSGGAGWYPEIPGEKPLFRVDVQAPPGAWPVTAGRLVKREETRQRTRTVWETTAPLPDLTLVAGPYRIKQRQAGPATVYTFFGSDHAALADSYLATAVADLKLYRDLFGPYPYPKFAVVENFFPTGYGFPSWTLLGSTIVPLPFIVTTSLGHEIAHNWWGTGVRVDYRHGNWSEGLATYVADYLFKEQTSQEAAREYRLKLLRDYATLVPPGGGYPLAGFTSRRSKLDQAIGYGKSAMVFHMARRRVGEDNFWGGLRRLAAEKMFQTATWTDFARAFDPDGSFGMNGFFRQWVERAGAPVLKLDTVRSKETNGRWQVSGRLLQQGPVYRLDLPIKIEFQEGPPDRDVLPVGAAATEFRLEVPRRPRRLSVDPDAEVFRRLDPGELPVTVNSLRSATDLWVVLTADLPDGTRKAVQDLLTGLRRSAVWVEAKDLSAHDLSGHDLLFVGWPRDPEKQPTLPASLAIDENGFTLAGQLFRGDEDVLFTTLPQPRDGQRTVAILLSSSARATAVAARKIPHYGKYSYLVFRAGSNRVKGTWPPAESPLSHDFAHTTGK